MASKIEPIYDRDRLHQLVSVNTDLSAENQAKVLGILAESGAVLSGHFSFRDCHSSRLLRFTHIGRMRNECDFLASLLVEQAGIDPDEETPLKVLASEVSGGMFLASEVARKFVVNTKNHFKKLVLTHADINRLPSNSFVIGQINPGNRVVVVSEIDRTGESVDRLIKIARRNSANVEAVLLFATCNQAEHKQRMVDIGVKSYHSLIQLDLGVIPKNDCPECAKGNLPEPVSTLV